jgi:hypothetical protein
MSKPTIDPHQRFRSGWSRDWQEPGIVFTLGKVHERR